MMGVVFLAQAGLLLDAATAVPYRGEAPAFADLIGGRVQFMIASGNKAHVDNGTLRVLATTGRTRSLLYPDIPTTTELGFDDVYYLGWYGLMAPVGTPLEIVQTLNEASARFLARDDVRKVLTDGGMEPVGGSIESFTQRLPTTPRIGSASPGNTSSPSKSRFSEPATGCLKPDQSFLARGRCTNAP